MVLTGAVPLALKPDAKSAAVIGIGTGLTMHTLLQSLSIESVETVEIESAMAEAARGFLPRNSASFADPRGAIHIDDAKTFFSTHNRRYDIVVSEPSNPWVSGVSSLFTREFYRRIRTHLNPDGLLVQWFQLYEIDTSLVASVMRALGEVFPHYVVFAASDHDLLIVASESAIPLPVKARVFEHPGLANELITVNIPTPGDLDARYCRRPRHARAAVRELRHGGELGLLPGARSERRAPPLHREMRHRRGGAAQPAGAGAGNAGTRARPAAGQSALQGRQRVRTGREYAARRVRARLPARCRSAGDRHFDQAAKGPELVKYHLIECRNPRDQDVWLHSLLYVAQMLNPYLSAVDADLVWQRIATAPCFAGLHDFQKQWIGIFRAVGQRNAVHMAELGGVLLANQSQINNESREYLWLAALTGYVAAGANGEAKKVWDFY